MSHYVTRGVEEKKVSAGVDKYVKRPFLRKVNRSPHFEAY